MSILAILFYAIGGLASLASFICFIMVLVQMFKRAGAGMGIVGIITCGIGAFIWGWIKAKEYGLSKIMMGWTAAIGISIICNIVAGGLAFSSPQFQEALKNSREAAAAPTSPQ